MKVYVKYLILLAGFWCATASCANSNLSAGFAAAGAFIAFALLEINDLKILNSEEEDDTRNS